MFEERICTRYVETYSDAILLTMSFECAVGIFIILSQWLIKTSKVFQGAILVRSSEVEDCPKLQCSLFFFLLLSIFTAYQLHFHY